MSEARFFNDLASPALSNTFIVGHVSQAILGGRLTWEKLDRADQDIRERSTEPKPWLLKAGSSMVIMVSTCMPSVGA